MEVCSQCDSSKATLDGKGTCTSRQGSLTGKLLIIQDIKVAMEHQLIK